jgi:hypothetical protein
MAIEKVVKISVDQVQAAGGLEKFVEGLDNTENKAQSLRTELRQLREQLAQLPEGSEEFNKIAQRAGEVSDKIGDISARVKNLGSDTKNIDAVVQGAQTLAGAFSIASSASALLGEENKDLQEQMVKVEAAIGLTVGIQSIANALQKESALAIGVSSAATKIQIGLQTAYAAVVGTTTGALKALKVALVTSGVGALVVALGFLISKMTESTEVTEDQDKALSDLTETQKRYNESLRKELDSLDNSTKARLLRAQIAGKSEKELREIEKEGDKEKQLAFENEIKRLDNELKAKGLSNAKFKLLQDERNKIADEALKFSQDLENKRLTFEAEQADKQRQDALKIEQERKQKLEQSRKDDLAKINEASKEITDALEEREKKKKEVLEQGEKILKDLELAKETPAQKLKREYEEKLAVLTQANLSTLELTAQFNAEMFALQQADNQKNLEEQQQFAIREQEIDQATKQAKRDALNVGLDILNQFAGKNKAIALGILAIQKGLAIADIVVNASKAIAVGQANLALVPAVLPPGIPNPAYPLAVANTAKSALLTKITAATSIASILTAGIGQSKSIISGGGGAGASSGGGVGGSSTPPNFNIVGQNPNNQLAQSIANRQSQPIEAYVVSGNVSTSQELDRNRISTATFN